MKLPSYTKNNTLAALCAFMNIKNEAEQKQWAVVTLRIGMSQRSLPVRIEFDKPKVMWRIASHSWSEIEDATDWCRDDLADEIDRILAEKM